MGVSDERVMSESNKAQRQLLMVTRRTCERHGQQAGEFLEGDILLTLDGSIITKMSDLDIMYSRMALDAVILAHGRN